MADQERIRNITDLAKLAGVSPGTVSRALADSRLIAKKTRERIQQLARDHDFRPNALASNLRTRRTGAVRVVIPVNLETGQHISDPFFMNMLGLLTDELGKRGYDLLLSRVATSDFGWLDRLADSGRVDGIILIGQSDQCAAIDRLADRYVPVVAWGASLPGQVHCAVGSDNRRGGEIAARHLVERGCRNFAFVGDPATTEISERLASCRIVLAEAGISEPVTILPASPSAPSIHAAIGDWLESGPRNGAIIAASDMLAMSALRALAEYGVTVPDQVRVVGYDDLAFADQTIPPLTTVRQDLPVGAQHLVDLLLRRVAGENTQPVILQPTLVIRQSS